MYVNLVIGVDEVKDLVLSDLKLKGIVIHESDLNTTVEDGYFRGFTVEMPIDSIRSINAQCDDIESKPKWQRLADCGGGNIIPAIKELRFQTNMGLKEAKYKVDNYRKASGI